MQFLRRHRYLLLFLAVLIFSCVMVLRQFRANEAAHFDLREDFIALHKASEMQACQKLFQRLIEELPRTSDQCLVNDLQRTAVLVDPKSADPQNLLWRYYMSVKSELDERAKNRLGGARLRAEGH